MILSSQTQNKIINFEKTSIVVFDASYKLSFSIKDNENSFIPTENEVRVANNLLNIFDIKNRHNKKIKKRQVFGYTKNGQKYILINDLPFKNVKQFETEFANWVDEFLFVFTDPPNLFNQLYSVNLLDETIGFFNN